VSRAGSGAHPKRVREAAEALLNKGLRPTIQRIRAMLGGGSPNVIAPILKEWRETLSPEQQLRLPLSELQGQRPEIPIVISDLVAELWKRAVVFATIECEGSPRALQFATLNEETELLRSGNRALMDQLESDRKENLSLREQLSQLQAIVKAALDRARASEERCAAVTFEYRSMSQQLTRKRLKERAERHVAKQMSLKRTSSATEQPERGGTAIQGRSAKRLIPSSRRTRRLPRHKNSR